MLERPRLESFRIKKALEESPRVKTLETSKNQR